MAKTARRTPRLHLETRACPAIFRAGGLRSGRPRPSIAILVNALHGAVSTTTFFAGDLIGYTTGLLITTLLLVLTLRAAKLPGTPRANIVFAVCGIFWSAGGMLHAGVLATGQPRDSLAALAAQALQYTGAAAFPIPILAIWRPFAVRAAGRRRRRACCGSPPWISAAVIAACFWYRSSLGNYAVPLRHALAARFL